jgi:hypothetical protein
VVNDAANNATNVIAERRFGKDAATNLLGTREGIRGDVRGNMMTDYDIGSRVEKCMFGNVSY